MATCLPEDCLHVHITGGLLTRQGGGGLRDRLNTCTAETYQLEVSIHKGPNYKICQGVSTVHNDINRDGNKNVYSLGDKVKYDEHCPTINRFGLQ